MKKVLFNGEDYASSDLLINPFRYNNSDGIVESLEDFAIQVKFGLFSKKETVYVRSIVRNALISKRKRFDIFKKYLRRNKKEYEKNIGSKRTENSRSKKDFSEIEFKRVSIIKMIIAVIYIGLSVALSMMFFSDIVSKFEVEFLTKISEGLQAIVNWNKYVVYGILGLVNLIAIWYFVYLLVFSITNNRFVRIQKRKYREMEKYYSAVNKAINVCYKKALKYYRKNIFRGNLSYEALVLYELWDLRPHVNQDDARIEAQARESKKIIRRNKRYEGKSKLFNSVILLLLISLLILEIVIYFI